MSNSASIKLVELVAKIAHPPERVDAINALSRHLRVEAVLVFVIDHEVGIFLSAAGFPQTLPDAAGWQRYLIQCAKAQRHEAVLPCPTQNKVLPVTGLAWNGQVVLVLAGSTPGPAELAMLSQLLPLLAVSLVNEQLLNVQAAQVRLARRMTEESTAIAEGLDNARRAAQKEIIARKNAEKALRESEAQQRFLLELGDALRLLADPDQVLITATRVLGEHLKADRVAYFEVDETNYVVRRDYTNGVRSLTGTYPVASFGAHLPAIYRSGQTALSHDVANDASLPHADRAAHLALQIAAFIGVPFIKDGVFVGGLTVHESGSRHWTAGEVTLIEETAERTWAAVERARAETALRESEEGQVFLLALSDALRALTSPADIAELAARRIGERFGLSRVFYAEISGTLMNVKQDYVSGVSSLAGQHDLAAFGPELLSAYRSGAVVKVNDVAVEPRLNNDARASLRSKQVGAFVDVVLFEEAECISLLAMQSARPRNWTRAEESLFREVAERVKSGIERARAEELLRDSEAQSAAATAAGAIGTWAWDITSNLITANPAFARAFGMDVERIRRGLPAEAYIASILAEDQPAVERAIAQAMAPDSDGVYTVEYRTRDTNGNVRWLSARGRVEFDDHRKPLRMPGALTDITERKHAEEALRTAKERAETASRSKDEFLAALSHELRTPLTPVLLTAATLKDDPRLAGDIREQLAMMERNIALEARLIDDLLDLTAISHGKLKMRSERCDLNTLVDRAVEMVARDAAEKNLSITRESRAPNPVLMADLTRIQQVVWNLLRNAVKFTPVGGKISIRTLATVGEEGTTWLTLEIVDSGIGIDAAQIARIFQPFDQGAHSGSHRFGGLGLGLAIAQGVVLAHGGRIQARSDGVGRGATFIVDLPNVQIAALHPSPASSSASRPPIKVAPLRLLLVEDHESTLQTLARLLRRDGHRVTTATSLASALTAAAQETFDLVISDLGLPDGTGTQLMDTLRSSHGLHGIALSGYGMEEDMVRSQKAGFVAHLVKPIAISDLRRAIEDISSP